MPQGFCKGSARISNSPSPISNLEHPCALGTVNRIGMRNSVNRTSVFKSQLSITLNAQGCSRLRIGDGELLIRAGPHTKTLWHRALAFVEFFHGCYDRDLKASLFYGNLRRL